MVKSYPKVYPFYVFVDVIFLALSFYVPYALKYILPNGLQFDNLANLKEHSFIYAFWAILIFLFFNRRGLYSTERSLTIPQEFFKVSLSVSYASISVIAVIFFAQYKFFSRGVFFENFLSLVLFLGLWRMVKRLIVRGIVSRGFNNINVLLIGATQSGKIFLEESKNMPWLGFKIIGFLDDQEPEPVLGVPALGKINNLPVIIKRYFIDEILISDNSQKNIVLRLIELAGEKHVGIRTIPEDLLEPVPIANISYFGTIPILTYKERKLMPFTFGFKKLLDLLASLIILTAFFPIFVIIGLLIKTDSPGKIFYIQKRVGLKGKIFNLYKFRSMVSDADNLKNQLRYKNEVKDGVIFKIKKDPRVTNFGRFLRKYSLDELPQLFNVLKGEMSLVGPRPPTPDEVVEYKDTYMKRLSVRPGITGLAQIRGRSDLTFYKWLRWDTWYINNWSLWLDLRILWLTFPAVIKGRGAY